MAVVFVSVVELPLAWGKLPHFLHVHPKDFCNGLESLENLPLIWLFLCSMSQAVSNKLDL